MSGPLDNCGLRREVVYADKEVVDMLEDKDAELTRLRAELAEKDELIRETMEALEYISRECIVKGAERFMRYRTQCYTETGGRSNMKKILLGCSHKTEYRIVKNDLGYYPQVKDNITWHKIAKHPTGYGLYPSDDYEYPKTIDECKKIIEDYKAWTKLSKEIKIVKEY